VGGNDGNIYALNAQTGPKLWSLTTTDTVYTSPAVANGVVYVTSATRNDTSFMSDGKLDALNAQSGAKLWNYTTKSAVFSSPAVANGVVYVGSDDGKLYAIGNRTTTLTLAASTTTPAVNQRVTFTITLKSGTTPLSSKPVTIYHYLNGVRYTDTNKTTNINGQITFIQSFGSAGQRTYYATFAGDSSYKASTSAVVTIRVH